MRKTAYVTATWLSLGLISAVTLGGMIPPHNTKYQRFSDWRRSSDIEDRRDDVALKGDMAPAGWAVYHHNH